MIESKNFTFDKIIPFTLKKSKIRGRFVKLDNSISKILNRHTLVMEVFEHMQVMIAKILKIKL